MITAVSIGENGRLGNQMFQFAALHGIARANGLEYWTPGGRLSEVFTLEGYSGYTPKSLPRARLTENSFDFDPRFLIEMRDEVDLHGYFQTEKYWSHVKDEVVKIFSFREDVKNVPNDVLDFCSKSKFLHARRTDYISSNGYHPSQDFEHYLNLVKPEEKIAIFSDDSEWADQLRKKCEMKGCSALSISSRGLKDSQELYLMTVCNSAVIANSTFSWWGAYLGPHQRNQRVIAPKKWFGSNGPGTAEDIYLENWERA